MIEAVGESASLLHLLRRHEQPVPGPRADLEPAELVFEDHGSHRFCRLDPDVPGQVGMRVVDRFRVLRGGIREGIEQCEPHLLPSDVELPPQQHLACCGLVTDVVDLKVIELQFVGGHRAAGCRKDAR